MVRRGLSTIFGKRTLKQTINQFDEEYGLVYFGNVSQHDDEQQIVRGMTVSHTHSDEHYSVGSYEAYDVSFVIRNDTTAQTMTGKVYKHRWVIMEFDLKTRHELPHIFIGLHSHSESYYQQLFLKYAHLRQFELTPPELHSPQFAAHYRVYGLLKDHVEFEQLLSVELENTFLSHFKSLAVEIHDGNLYVYSEHVPSMSLLEAIIKNGTWLAGHIDSVYRTSV